MSGLPTARERRRLIETARDILRDDAIPKVTDIMTEMQRVIDVTRTFIDLEQQRVPHPLNSDELAIEEAARLAYEQMVRAVASFDRNHR